MPEACFLSIDSSEYMRNGDYFPSRLMGVQEAAQLLCNAKTQMNRENTIGFLTTGGTSCNVMETLTDDIDRVQTSLVSISLSAKVAHFARGLQIAALALSHRGNPRAEKRIVAFVGSPIRETQDDLIKLAKKLRKDNVAVDIVALGGSDNNEVLEAFVAAVNKDENSRLLVVPPGRSVVDVLMTSAIFLGNDAVASAAAGGAPAGGNSQFEFGFDPAMDPELAMVLRMSMEDEQLRQQRAAQQQAQAAPPSTSDATTPQHQTSSAAQPAVEPQQQPAASSSTNPQGAEHELTEEEMMELALKMSLEQYNSSAAEDQTAATTAKGDAATAAPTTTNNGSGTATEPNAVDPEAQRLFDDEEFMKQLKDSLDDKK